MEAFIEYFVPGRSTYMFCHYPATALRSLTLDRDFLSKVGGGAAHHDIAHFQFPDYDKVSCVPPTVIMVQAVRQTGPPLESLGLPERLTIIPSGILSPCFRSMPCSLNRRKDAELQAISVPDPSLRYQLRLFSNPSGCTANAWRQPALVGFAPALMAAAEIYRLEHNISLLGHPPSDQANCLRIMLRSGLQEATNRPNPALFSSHARYQYRSW